MIKLNQAVILAGGRGERLRPLTDKIPKPLVPINGVPFLDYLINSIIQAGIKRILILTGYKGEIIVQRYGNLPRTTESHGCKAVDEWKNQTRRAIPQSHGCKPVVRGLLNDGIDIEYSIGAVEDQTGRRLLNAYGLLDDYFLLLYGDNFWPIELNKMLDLYKEKNPKVLATVFSNKIGSGEYGYENNICVGKDSVVRQYDKQRKSSDLNGVDIGYFIVDRSALNSDISSNVSFEEYIIPKLISERQLIAYITDTQYYYITNMDSIKNLGLAVIKKNIKPIPRDYFKGR